MAKRVEFDGVVHEFPDDFTDADIQAALGTEEPSAPARGMLPMAGAFGGSLLGTIGGIPGRIAGAGIGGALGKGAEMLTDDTDQGFMEGATAMGTEGLKQAGFEAAGGVVGKALKAGGSRLFQSMLKPSKAVRQEFPTVVRDSIKAGVPVGKRGAEKADRLVTEAGQRTRETLASAEAAGAKPVNMRPVVASLGRTRAKVAKQPMREADLQTVRGVRNQALKENPHPISLTQAQEMKQAAQRVAGEGYSKIAKGGDVNSVPLDANMDLASGLRAAIERRVPAVAPLNQRTQKLIGVRRAAEDAEGRIANNAPIGLGMSTGIAGAAGLGAGAFSGDTTTGAGTAAAILALTNPALASRLAIGMDRAAPVASFTPQMLRAALLAQLAQQDKP